MNIVVATCKNRGIGIKNQLPWRLLADLYFFKYLTIGNEKNAENNKIKANING